MDGENEKTYDFTNVLNAAQKAFKTLHKRGSYKPEDLTRIKAYKNLIDETRNVINTAIPHDVPQKMREYLEKDVHIFSGLKTHAQLTEARSLLMDNGKVRSYESFEQKVIRLNEAYNRDYLQAEYQFAVTSSQSAANWENLQDNTDRYWLEYRTAGDERVRAEHRALHGICLPKNDPFWKLYYPPNGWRCRCVAVEVLADDYTLSDSAKSIKKGETATTTIGKSGKNTAEMFRFNPGIEKQVFPSKNTYEKVVGADKVIKNIEKQNEKFVPKIINKYEEKIGVKINRDFFSNLEKETPLHFVNPRGSGVKSTGAYFHPIQNFVKIPIDDRRKNSSWYGEAIFYHEYGHAIDWQKGLKNLDSLSKTMTKHRKLVLDDFEKYKKLDKKLYDMGYRAYKNKNNDLLEMVGAVQDTLKSIDIRIGAGHSDTYFKQKGNAEAEFIAHAFENKYKGNKVFKKYLPELYDDMIKFLDDSLK
ncbi:phage head morphogenesis protein [Empedobacter falsenii]